MCYLNDDSVPTAIPADILERMLNNAETILNIEAPGICRLAAPPRRSR